jgi:gas vesicle protein
MKNIQIKSLLLGIGLGIIITSIAGMIYFAGENIRKENPPVAATSSQDGGNKMIFTTQQHETN